MIIPSRNDLLDAQKRILQYIHKTPVFTSRLIDEMVGGELFFKAENLQRMGAFKKRGASNAILSLSKEKLEKGVATHSSGNFAQALALTAKEIGIQSYIVMPENAPSVKKEAVRNYSGKIIECESNLKSREETLDKVVAETGATFIHPYNQMEVILGNATATMELSEQVNDLDFVITPIGGGGLISGTALAAHYFLPNAKVIGSEPLGADDAYRSLKTGKIIPCENPQTIADGLRTSLGTITFPLIQKFVPEIFTVEEQEIIDAMLLIWERLKIVIEPSSAVPLAAILKNKAFFQGKRIGIILSGGNVDIRNFKF